jgi:plastocyanin
MQIKITEMKTRINKSETTAILIFVQIALLFLVTDCSKPSNMGNSTDPGNVQADNEVFIQNMAFNPSTLTVPVNTTVQWTNKDGIAHTVTSKDGLFNSGPISSGRVFTWQFTTAGTYNYFCSIHPDMTGKIIVQ